MLPGNGTADLPPKKRRAGSLRLHGGLPAIASEGDPRVRAACGHCICKIMDHKPRSTHATGANAQPRGASEKATPMNLPSLPTREPRLCPLFSLPPMSMAPGAGRRTTTEAMLFASCLLVCCPFACLLCFPCGQHSEGCQTTWGTATETMF